MKLRVFFEKLIQKLVQNLVQNQLWLWPGAVTPIHSIQGDVDRASVSVPGMNAWWLHFNAVAHLPL